MDTDRENQLLSLAFTMLNSHLDEKSRRLTAAAVSISLGFGGVKKVHKATGIARSTIIRGKYELEKKKIAAGRIRAKGAGRKKASETDKTLLSDLDKLVEPMERGDPETPLRWTTKSFVKLANTLKTKGHLVSHVLVGRLLKKLGYSPQSLRKRHEGKQHPDRNLQFLHIATTVKKAILKGFPVLSVDCKKKELIGNFKNNHGQEWRRKKHPVETSAYDYPSDAKGIARPYGVYDLKRNEGFVSVGVSSETSMFSVNSIRKWWELFGQKLYANASEIVITADCGGSNGNKRKLWKYELQKFANNIHKTIHVLHFPPGTSKWNKVEHRLFSQISITFRGKVLTSYEVLIQLISHTATSKGLKVYAQMDRKTYEKGIKVPDDEWKKIKIIPEDFHPEWNYMISPQV